LTIRCANGNTLLHEAALHLPPGAIDILIYHGLKVDDVNHAGETALMLACEKERVGVVERLLANGASANTYRSKGKGATLLHIAVSNSRVGIVRALVRFGHIPVDVVDFKRNTPLMYACRSGDSDRSQACIRELIDLGANINYQGKHGNTVLHHTAQNKHSSEVLKLLLSYPQTKVGVKNAAKQTALKVACDEKNLAAIKLLLEHGAIAERAREKCHFRRMFKRIY
jgi:ankyrin repeat protein